MDSWVNTRSQMPWLPHWSAPLVAQDAHAELRRGLATLGFHLLSLRGEDMRGERDFLGACGNLLGGEPDVLSWDNFADSFLEILGFGPERVALIWSRADRLLQEDLHTFLMGVHLLKEVQYRMAVRKIRGAGVQFAFYLLGCGGSFDARPRRCGP